MNRFLIPAAAAALGIATAVALLPTGTASAIMPAATDIGPAIGSRIAPATTLTDARGAPTTLARIGAGRPVMIVMFRSAAWCPYCQRQLKGLAPVAAAAKAKGVRLIAVSYDTPATLSTFATRQSIAFPLYSDTGSRMIDTLRLRDPQYKPDSIAYGVPYPTILVIDGKGVVKAKAVETDYRTRPSEADLIAMLGKA